MGSAWGLGSIGERVPHFPSPDHSRTPRWTTPPIRESARDPFLGSSSAPAQGIPSQSLPSEHLDQGLACLEPPHEFRQQRDEFGPQLDLLEIADPEPKHCGCGLTQPRPLGEVFVFRHKHKAGIERDSPNHRIPQSDRSDLARTRNRTMKKSTISRAPYALPSDPLTPRPRAMSTANPARHPKSNFPSESEKHHEPTKSPPFPHHAGRRIGSFLHESLFR